MIEFTITAINPDTVDIELLRTIFLTINEQIQKSNFLASFITGYNSGINIQEIKYSFRGACIAREEADELSSYIFNLFNEILTKAGVRGVVYISNMAFGEQTGDRILRLSHTFSQVTRNQTLLGNLLKDDEIPAEFKCVLSDQIMDSPVRISGDPTNKYYNKAHLRHLLFTKETQAQVDPFTRKPLNIHEDITKDEPLKQKISAFVKNKITEKSAERVLALKEVENKYFPGNISMDNIQATLRICAATNDLKSAEVLLEHFKLDVNDQDKKPGSGKTPLHHAVANKHPEMVRLLISKGARVDTKDAYSKSPSVYALESGDTAVIAAVMGNIDLSKLTTSVQTMKK